MMANREELVELIFRTICLERNGGDCTLGCTNDTGCLDASPNAGSFEMRAANAVAAAIAELTQAPAVPSDALTPRREAQLIESLANGFLEESCGDPQIHILESEAERLAAFAVRELRQALSRPAEPVQGEVTEAVLAAGAAAYHGSNPMMIDCDDRRDEMLTAIYRAMQAAAAREISVKVEGKL